jgi:photosystem II stability/assembly factor-like uncharacterized protein
MRGVFLILGIFVFLILSASIASFADNQWIAIGPEEVRVKAIAINPKTPETFYIGTTGFGVFKSIDGGATWININTGLSGSQIMALVIDPQTPETLYAGIEGGVFKSVDGGSNWIPVNTGLTSTHLRSLAIDPQAPETLYAGTYGGVFKSVDGGATWIPINTGLRGISVQTVVIDPQAPETLYAGMDESSSTGIFKSIDGGANWTAINTGIPGVNTFAFTTIHAIAIDPVMPETLYAGIVGERSGPGVFKSVDGGAHWALSETGINTGLHNTFAYALAIDPRAPETLYAGTDGGVFKSVDGATNWNPFRGGLPHTTVEVLAIDPQTPGILYAGIDGFGVFKINMGAGPMNPSLTVSKPGSGNGTVTSDPVGIDCGTACWESYDPGTAVTLTATAESGSTFTGWSGECSGTGTCSVTVNSDKAVVAVFDLQGQYGLRITKSGTGSGTVASSPAGIDCGDDCTETYPKVQRVRLMAKPDADSTFGGWSGGSCLGTGICVVTVDSPTLITGSFIKKIPHFSVSPISIDFGSVKTGRSIRKRLAITNSGTGDLSVVAGGLEGTDFTISGRAAVTVKPKRTIYLSVAFRPSSTGSQVTLLKIASNDPDAPSIDLPLTGIGR